MTRSAVCCSITNFHVHSTPHTPTFPTMTNDVDAPKNIGEQSSITFRTSIDNAFPRSCNIPCLLPPDKRQHHRLVTHLPLCLLFLDPASGPLRRRVQRPPIGLTPRRARRHLLLPWRACWSGRLPASTHPRKRAPRVQARVSVRVVGDLTEATAVDACRSVERACR